LGTGLGEGEFEGVDSGVTREGCRSSLLPSLLLLLWYVFLGEGEPFRGASEGGFVLF
jgi:hypothetical protein